MKCMLSTKDNPFNPLTQFDEWYAYDAQHGYHSSEYLARIVKTAVDLSPSDQEQLIEDAIDEILEMNPDGIYIKVVQK